MENLVDKIIEIDDVAEQMIKTAEEHKKDLLSDMEEKKVKITQDIQEKANKKLEAFENSYKSTAEQEILQIKEKEKQQIHRLETAFSKNQAIWITQITKEILHEV